MEAAFINGDLSINDLQCS